MYHCYVAILRLWC